MATKVVDRVIDESVSQLPLAAPLAVRPVDNGAIVHAQALTVEDLLATVAARGGTPEELEKWLTLHERVSKKKAEQEFRKEKAEFQGKCPAIRKTGRADIVTKSGARYSYDYPELDEIARTVGPFLHPRGFSYGWDWRDDDKKPGQLIVTCTLSHTSGHSESASFPCPIDSANEKITGAQKNSGALTTARRQALIMVLGLTTCDKDTDAAREPADAGPKIDEHTIANIKALADEVGADKARFLEYFEIDSIDQLPKSRAREAIGMLEKKRGGNKA